MAKKTTNVTIDFENWLTALVELKRRKMTFSEFVDKSLSDFVDKVEKQKRGDKHDKEGRNPSEQS
jgi:hypothetical protein